MEEWRRGMEERGLMWSWSTSRKEEERNVEEWRRGMEER